MALPPVLYAPRPFYRLTDRMYRLGMNFPRGYWPFLNRNPYRQQRRPRIARQFHGSSPDGALWASGVRPLAPACTQNYSDYDRCAQFGPCGPNCAHAPAGQHATIARPLWSDSPARRLRDSRARPAVLHGISGDLGTFAPLRPRQRSIFARTAGTLHYLAARRQAVAQCKRRGFERIRQGIWYDRQRDVIYLQADVITASGNISRVRYA